jgi:hypothetical protein
VLFTNLIHCTQITGLSTVHKGAVIDSSQDLVDIIHREDRI